MLVGTFASTFAENTQASIWRQKKGEAGTATASGKPLGRGNGSIITLLQKLENKIEALTGKNRAVTYQKYCAPAVGTFTTLGCSAPAASLASDVTRTKCANTHRTDELGTIGGRLSRFLFFYGKKRIVWTKKHLWSSVGQTKRKGR